MRTRFRKEQVLGSVCDDNLGLGLRSAIKNLSLVDDDTTSLVILNAKRLPLLHWEDILLFQEGDCLRGWRSVFPCFAVLRAVIDKASLHVCAIARALSLT